MVKEELLKLLEENRGEILPGNDLKDALGVSRNAVWKAIQLLKEEGHHIESIKNKGYTLLKQSDVLSVGGLTQALGAQPSYHVEVLEEVPSTNTYLKESDGKKNNTLVFAKKQTKGRGRLGRSFFSEDPGGLYFSLLKIEDLLQYNPAYATIACALSVRDALSEVSGLSLSIKWVNDIYYEGKKLAGILTEGTLEMETGTLSSLILGIGINVNTGSFPRELEDIATSLFMETGRTYVRQEVAKSVLSHLEKNLLLTKENPDALLASYKKHLLYLGEEITFLYEKKPRMGILKDLTAEGHLLVESEGSLLTLHSGEISIRKGDQT
ncbi:biotin--[acetyl-CoA-carboxylase] ligase [Proteiniclasticum ruminis]|uniref:Bifunctional ligase/repressor BirA n=1 Tax=Proteiniclasticum ruminis TaxID=398199 RepID=A0A1I4ZZV6_9CLOT|nr:biotin--[acetyl-CoA-carboxylase] ligase [Proteiniclasticum ruminis]SFN55670.1 BirA family transcriptional regulator, biotin operon repressor / biotin-[acetyl-CoA-carboxylase] ligase [Proteiniclasticum ruminis]